MSGSISNFFQDVGNDLEDVIDDAATEVGDAADDVRAILGEHAAGLDDLWIAWEVVRPVLFEEAPDIDPAPGPGEAVAEPSFAAGGASATGASTDLAG